MKRGRSTRLPNPSLNFESRDWLFLMTKTYRRCRNPRHLWSQILQKDCGQLGGLLKAASKKRAKKNDRKSHEKCTSFRLETTFYLGIWRHFVASTNKPFKKVGSWNQKPKLRPRFKRKSRRKKRVFNFTYPKKPTRTSMEKSTAVTQ